MRVTQKDVTVTRNLASGSYTCSAVIDGQLVSKVYFGYTKRECVQKFVNGVNATNLKTER